MNTKYNHIFTQSSACINVQKHSKETYGKRGQTELTNSPQGDSPTQTRRLHRYRCTAHHEVILTTEDCCLHLGPSLPSAL